MVPKEAKRCYRRLNYIKADSPAQEAKASSWLFEKIALGHLHKFAERPTNEKREEGDSIPATGLRDTAPAEIRGVAGPCPY